MPSLLAYVAIVITAGFVLLSGYILAEAMYYQCLNGPGLERDLGFKEGSAIMPNSSLTGYEAAVAIESVDDAGIFGRAGFRAGDVLPDETHSTFFRKLHQHRGRVARFRVAAGGPGPSFRDRPRREIHVAVPRSLAR